MAKKLAIICQRNNNIPFLFEVAHRHGIDVVDIYDSHESPQPDWPCIVGHVSFEIFADEDGSLEQFKQWAIENAIDGIMTSREEAIIWTSKAAALLNLPNISVDAAMAARNKAEMRRRFEQAGCNVPRFLDLDLSEDFERLDDLHFPFVVKPKSAVCSAGVTLVANQKERDNALAQISKLNRSMIGYNALESYGSVAEEYISGHEFVAECFAVDGDVNVVSLGYKGNPEGPYFEETVYLAPAKLPPEIQLRAIEEAKKGMRALGLDNGPGHCEMRITNDGMPYILEIGARVGGSGSCHFVVEESTGFDFFGNQMKYALGESVEIKGGLPNYLKHASNYIIPLRGHGILLEIEGLTKLESNKQCKRVMRFMGDNSIAKPYPEFSGFIGFIFGVHSSYEEGIDHFKWLDDNVYPVWQ